jgi:RNA polymerase sigma factor (sigma-70 family)
VYSSKLVKFADFVVAKATRRGPTTVDRPWLGDEITYANDTSEMARQHRSSKKMPSTRVTLLARIRQSSDAEAWTTFVDLYTPLVYNFCRGRDLQDADSRDVTQQVLAIIHRTIARFEYNQERGRFRNWLGAVTAHEISRHLRKERRPGKGVGDGWGDDMAELSSAAVDPSWAEEFNAYIFQLALARIQPEFSAVEWQAFEQTWLKELKPLEVAKKMNQKSAWVYKTKFRVIERLKKELDFLTSDAAMFHKPT